MTRVVAAVIEKNRKYLACRRPGNKRHGGLWEFPGGKVESTENPRLALARELAEELAVNLDPALMEPFAFAEEAGQGERPGVVLFLYTCRGWSGPPQALDGQDFGWFAPAEAAGLPLAPMDRRLLQRFAG